MAGMDGNVPVGRPDAGGADERSRANGVNFGIEMRHCSDRRGDVTVQGGAIVYAEAGLTILARDDDDSRTL